MDFVLASCKTLAGSAKARWFSSCFRATREAEDPRQLSAQLLIASTRSRQARRNPRADQGPKKPPASVASPAAISVDWDDSSLA